jgi:hypothetical protein
MFVIVEDTTHNTSILSNKNLFNPLLYPIIITGIAFKLSYQVCFKLNYLLIPQLPQSPPQWPGTSSSSQESGFFCLPSSLFFSVIILSMLFHCKLPDIKRFIFDTKIYKVA